MNSEEIKKIFEKSQKDHAEFEKNQERRMKAQAARETAPSQGGAVTTDMRVAEILDIHPSAAEYLVQDWNMACISCPASQTETLAQAAMVHGLDAEEVCASLNDFLEDTAMIQAEEIE
jgi:hybrid cluster-associated redox disulfide protein